MAYRVTAQVQVQWVGPGLGPMGGQLAPALPSGPAGGAQMIEFVNQAGGYNTNTFLAGDITTLTNALAADMVTQMTAQITRIQNFSTGTG
ncbi:MAG: hypothetical protein KGL35_24925 [Bradyrhizobium sp.]|nr:hypothetical protein [Bradyrhizobium sp.]